jgi:beta-lactamase class A
VTLGGSAALGAEGLEVETRVRDVIQRFRGVMGVAAKDLQTGRTVFVDADRRFPTASTIKTAVMIEVFHAYEDGRLRRDTVAPLVESEKVGGSGVLKQLHQGLPLSVADLVSLMITVSDNTATNMLVGLVGTEAVDRRLAGYGFTETRLMRPTFRDGRADVFPELEAEFGLGVTTPREMARLMELIAEGRVVSRAACDEMIAILRGQTVDTMIPRGLPADDGLRVANKTGTDAEKAPDRSGVLRHVRADAAIVEGAGRRYVIAIYARQVQDTSWGPDNEALVAGAEVSRLVYEAFAAGKAGEKAAKE